MLKHCLPLLSALALALGQTPVFDDPVTVDAHGVPINVGYGGNASPFVVDWDGDGKQDLLLGQYSGGNVRFYPNIGTNFAPVFGDFEYLRADGSNISVSYG
jgi:hypothetical protein